MADKTEKKSKGFFAGVKRFFGRIGKFFRDTVSEMKKVVWPSKKQIINNTVVVAVVVVVAAVLIGPGRCVRLRAEPVAEGRVTVRTFKAESGVLTNGRG